ncbi:cyclin-G2-like [Gigantopelta aegis]|uniref:cyclin-G2-like n=1 Tax=Gigantopelta aegis TaxID=1735272 RepID=UPI001B888EA4|nr:cyclin-G2-like [Gigantopelta aegis]
MVVHKFSQNSEHEHFTSALSSADERTIQKPLLIPEDIEKLIIATGSIIPNNSSVLHLDEDNLHLRSKALTLIRCLHLFFGTLPDTFAVAANVLDKFLIVVKIKEKYLSCIASACYFIASKIHQEDEELPTTADLAHLHGNKWRSSDLCRMERVILQKIKWDVSKTTCLCFIRLFHELFVKCLPMFESSCCLETMLVLAENSIRVESSTVFKPSTVAWCIVHSHLKEKQLLLPQCRTFLLYVQRICQIYDSEIFECNQLLLKYLSERRQEKLNTQRLSHVFPFVKRRCRPSSEGESELPVIIEDCQAV